MPDQSTSALAQRTIEHYLNLLASTAPAPGGGSASGIVGALGGNLGVMVLALTDLDTTPDPALLKATRAQLERLQGRFLELAEIDESAYAGYLTAAALPKSTPEEKADRRRAMQDALKHAASVPLAMCEASIELAELLGPVIAHGNPHLRSDGQVAAVFAGASFTAARVLVDANLAMIKDAGWVANVTARLDDLAERLRVANTP